MTRQTEGYTLLEMLVVIAIVAVMSTLALSTVKTDQTPQSAHDWAEVIERELLRARSEAVSSGRAVQVSFDNKQNMLRDDQTATVAATIPPNIKLRTRTGKFPEATDERAIIMFLPSGASTGGTISLTRDNEVTRLDVNWLTGDIAKREQAAP